MIIAKYVKPEEYVLIHVILAAAWHAGLRGGDTSTLDRFYQRYL